MVGLLQTEVFGRDDYEELAELVVVWLKGLIMRKGGFVFRRAQDVTSARFMEKAKYYLKMELTISQTGDKMQYTESQREEVRRMAEFVGLFYARWFLKSAKSDQSSWNDLTAIHELRQYRSFHPDLAEAGLKS